MTPVRIRNGNGNGRPEDVPPWAWVLIQEVRESNRQAAEDRRQAALDRGRFDGVVAQIARHTREVTEAITQLKQAVMQLANLTGVVIDRLERQETALHRLIEGQSDTNRKLDQIARLLKVQGNGHARGNGRPR